MLVSYCTKRITLPKGHKKLYTYFISSFCLDTVYLGNYFITVSCSTRCKEWNWFARYNTSNRIMIHLFCESRCLMIDSFYKATSTFKVQDVAWINEWKKLRYSMHAIFFFQKKRRNLSHIKNCLSKTHLRRSLDFLSSCF